MAHLGYKQEAVLDAIVNRLLSDVDSMNQRDVADLLSALAMLKHQPVGEAMAAVVHHTIEVLQDPGGMTSAVKRVHDMRLPTLPSSPPPPPPRHEHAPRCEGLVGSAMPSKRIDNTI